MKVSNVGSSKDTSGTRRKTAVSGAGEAFAKHLAEAVSAGEAPAIGEARSVQSAEALLAIQEAETSTERSARQFAHHRGENLLAHLNKLKDGVLAGALPKKDLADLAQALRAPRKPCADPRLESILDEIELRAEVELAKLTREP